MTENKKVTDKSLEDMISWAETGPSSGLNWCRPDLVLVLRELQAMRKRYRFQENQRLCKGYGGYCDGDLVGIAHESGCPARELDFRVAA